MQSVERAAENDGALLRYLDLDIPFGIDPDDMMAFFHLLSDINHPVTRHLQELEVYLSVPDTHIHDFQHAWSHMLQQNRTLYTISLRLGAVETVDNDKEPVAIRTGPLNISRKLAFLSIGEEVLGLLDASVIAMIFAYAAPHRLRMIEIEFTPRFHPRL